MVEEIVFKILEKFDERISKISEIQGFILKVLNENIYNITGKKKE